MMKRRKWMAIKEDEKQKHGGETRSGSEGRKGGREERRREDRHVYSGFTASFFSLNGPAFSRTALPLP